jgi:hypothetical protein
MTPEGKVKAIGQKMMRLYANVYYHMPVQNGMGNPTLDFIICCNGYSMAVETKTPGKKATPRQEITMEAMRKAGCFVFLVDGQEGWNIVEAHMIMLGATPHAIQASASPSGNRRPKVSGLLQRPEDNEEDRG